MSKLSEIAEFKDKIQKSTTSFALTGVSQWIERWPVNQRVAGSIPSQGTCLSCGASPQSGGLREATTH